MGIGGWRRYWRVSVVALALLTGLAVAMAASAQSGNAVQNGDFTASAQGQPITDWAQTNVTLNPTGCNAGPPGNDGGLGAGGCNGPYVYVNSGGMPCNPLASNTTPYLALDTPENSDAYVQQEVTVPPNGVLTFISWGNFQPSEATISIVAGAQTNVVDTFEPPPMQAGTPPTPAGCSGSSVYNGDINLSAYAGQTVGLRIESTAESSDPTDNYDGVFSNFDNLVLQSGSGGTTSTGPTTTTTPGAKRKSSSSVSCTADFSTGTDTCGATVADASGDSPITPTGTVTFTTSGGGSFLGTGCALQQTPYSPGISSCTLGFRPTNVNVVPDITAHYQGDVNFDPSSGGVQLGPDDDSKTSGTGATSTENDDGDKITQPDTEPPDSTSVDVTNNDTSTEPASETEDDSIGTVPRDHPAIDGVIAGIQAGGQDRQQAIDYMKDALKLSDEDISDVLDGVDSGNPQDLTSILDFLDSTQAEISSDNGDNSSETFDDGSGSDFGGGGGDDAADLGRTTRSFARAAAGIDLGPSPKSVAGAIISAHPSGADVRAFDQELALATAPVYSLARAYARFVLILTVDDGILTLAHDLGYKSSTQLLQKLGKVTLGSASVRLHAHHKTRVVIRASGTGARLLRVLDIVGLGHKVLIELKVTVIAHHHKHTVTRAIRVI
jgi:hypothetical protein